MLWIYYNIKLFKIRQDQFIKQWLSDEKIFEIDKILKKKIDFENYMIKFFLCM